MLCIDIMAILSIFLCFYCDLYYTTTAIQLVVITRKHLLQVFIYAYGLLFFQCALQVIS